MNLMGWLVGGGSAPLIVGFLANHIGLGKAVAFTSSAYVGASILLSVAAFVFSRRDIERMQLMIKSDGRVEDWRGIPKVQPSCFSPFPLGVPQ
jgi:hypothetical protein